MWECLSEERYSRVRVAKCLLVSPAGTVPIVREGGGSNCLSYLCTQDTVHVQG